MLGASARWERPEASALSVQRRSPSSDFNLRERPITKMALFGQRKARLGK